jgi:hypothetical protein
LCVEDAFFDFFCGSQIVASVAYRADVSEGEAAEAIGGAVCLRNSCCGTILYCFFAICSLGLTVLPAIYMIYGDSLRSGFLDPLNPYVFLVLRAICDGGACGRKIDMLGGAARSKGAITAVNGDGTCDISIGLSNFKRIPIGDLFIFALSEITISVATSRDPRNTVPHLFDLSKLSTVSRVVVCNCSLVMLTLGDNIRLLWLHDASIGLLRLRSGKDALDVVFDSSSTGRTVEAFFLPDNSERRKELSAHLIGKWSRENDLLRAEEKLKKLGFSAIRTLSCCWESGRSDRRDGAFEKAESVAD